MQLHTVCIPYALIKRRHQVTYPAMHSLQVVRELGKPPEVCEPAAQVWHTAIMEVVLYLSSAPQARHSC